jgi:hypothetical protein
MDEPARTFAPELSPAASKRWIGRLLIAVVLGAAIWNFLASLTTAVILPGLARIMEADPQSPLYLGKGDFNVPGIFASMLELCLAAIAALVITSWSQKRPRTIRRKSANVAPAPSLSFSAPPVRESVGQSAPPVAVPPVPPAASPVSVPPPAADLKTQPPAVVPAQAPKPEKPAKPKPPKEVYYNLVGEPVDQDDE